MSLRECSPIISRWLVGSNWTLRRWVGSEITIVEKRCDMYNTRAVNVFSACEDTTGWLDAIDYR